MSAELNLAQALALMDGLAAAGVRRVVASPGSRSTPLVLAAHRHPRLALRMVLDERSAAWFALGQGLASGRPTALVATSGTAVGEWLPAVMEADLARVPLLLVSADRPPELQGRGANQTCDQQGIFGPRVRAFHPLPVPAGGLERAVRALAVQAVSEALAPLPGPVHLNQPLREPLTPGGDTAPWEPGPPVRLSAVPPPPDPADLDDLAGILDGTPGLILCGPALGHPLPARAVSTLAEAAGAPILADPLSGLRTGGHPLDRVLSRQDAFLRRPGAPSPAWILRLGGAPVSRALGEYISGQERARHILVDPHGRWSDPWHRVDHYLQADPGPLCLDLSERIRPARGDWFRRWRALDDQTAPRPPLPFEARLVAALVDHLPAGARLFGGNSLAIRLLDAFLHPSPRPLHLYCNRGVSGIDGNLATLFGIAATTGGPVVGLVGDLSLLHDLGSLSLAAGLNALILVLDNGGGGIFGLLPQAGLKEFEELFLTPQTADLATLAGAFGVGYLGLDEGADLVGGLSSALAGEGVRILHIRLDRGRSLARLQRYWRCS